MFPASAGRRDRSDRNLKRDWADQEAAGPALPPVEEVADGVD